MSAPCIDDLSGAHEQGGIDDGLIGALGADPHLPWVLDAPLLQLEGDFGEDVVADVFLVGEDLVDGGASPWPTKIRSMSLGIELFRDLALRPVLIDEHMVHRLHNPLFLFGTRHQNDPVGLKAFLFATRELTLRPAVLVDEDAAKTVSSGTALPEAQFDEAALAGEDLDGKLTAVFTSHDALYGLQQVRTDAAVVFELLAAVMDPDTRA